MPNTFFGRLFISSLMVLGLFFGLIYYIISQLSLDNIHQSKQEQLRLQNYVLLSSTQIGDSGIELPDEFREARFDQFESGLYGFISDNYQRYASTYSAHSIDVDHSLLTTRLSESGQSEFVVTKNYFIFRYIVQWEITDDSPQLLTFTVLEDKGPTLEAYQNFQRNIRHWLMGVGLVLIALLLITMRWGTKPLRQLADNVKQIEQGKQDQIKGVYPLELRGVTRNINELINAERKQRERYHSTLADLAHSLKTPLAVIQTELESEGSREKFKASTQNLLAEQIQRMAEIIKHQLQRAVIASSSKMLESTAVQPCVDRLVNAMTKVYADKNINFELQLAPGCAFKGDQRDLMEVLGNILDNACKACHSKVKIVASNTGQNLLMELHDDGAGIAEADRKHIIQRGQRADTRHAGQGIGLDVSRDIVESYGGKLSISDSPLGGALIRLEFSASR